MLYETTETDYWYLMKFNRYVLSDDNEYIRPDTNSDRQSYNFFDMFDPHDPNNSPYIKFANITTPQEALVFCNEFGLPFNDLYMFQSDEARGVWLTKVTVMGRNANEENKVKYEDIPVKLPAGMSRSRYNKPSGLALWEQEKRRRATEISPWVINSGIPVSEILKEAKLLKLVIELHTAIKQSNIEKVNHLSQHFDESICTLLNNRGYAYYHGGEATPKELLSQIRKWPINTAGYIITTVINAALCECSPCIKLHWGEKTVDSSKPFIGTWEAPSLLHLLYLKLYRSMVKGLVALDCANENCSNILVPKYAPGTETLGKKHIYCSKKCRINQTQRNYDRKKAKLKKDGDDYATEDHPEGQ